MQRVLLVVIWLALAALAAIVRAGGDTGLPGELAVLQGLAGLGEGTRAAAHVLSRLTGTVTWALLVLVLCGVLWWRGQSGAALLLFGIQVSADLVSLVLKALVDRPRPVDATLSEVVATASFPSSHAARATVTLGFLLLVYAWRIPGRRLPASVGALALLLTIGLARLATGEHWPTDVLGGYLLGAAWHGTVWMVAAERAGIKR